MDLSFLMVFSKKKNIDPTGRQNFGDAPGQIPKLILTLCHMRRALCCGVIIIFIIISITIIIIGITIIIIIAKAQTIEQGDKSILGAGLAV